MIKFTIDSQPMVGFASEKAEPGEKVKILVKTKLITSDNPMFHLHMKHITDTFIAKTTCPVVSIQKLLIILHKDNTADIYINDFAEILRVKVNKSIKAGERVYRSNVSDITHLKFPDIEIVGDDAIVYCIRTDWRFSLYFDFSRELDLELLAKELGELKREAEFHTLIISAEDEVNRIATQNAEAIILTEGKSDFKHLEKSASELKIPLELAMWASDEDRGSSDLLKMCEHFARVPQQKKMIFIFDRDEEKTLNQLSKKDKKNVGYQDWGNNVFSMALPVPSHRLDNDCAISVEFFYTDEEIKTKDKSGRRLFLSDEFDNSSGRHLLEDLNANELNKVKSSKKKIIDNKVFNNKNENVALSKAGFAERVSIGDDDFADFNFEQFQLIFDVIGGVIKR